MESIITSFKKRQRQIIESFIEGVNAGQNPDFIVSILESEVKDEIKLIFMEVLNDNRLSHTMRVNLLEYRLNDVRPEAINERLKQIVIEGFKAARKEQDEYIRSILVPSEKPTEAPVEEEDYIEPVKYELFFQVEPNASEPYCIGIRVIGMEEQIPLNTYGVNPQVTLQKFIDVMKDSNFAIVLFDKE